MSWEARQVGVRREGGVPRIVSGKCRENAQKQARPLCRASARGCDASLIRQALSCDDALEVAEASLRTRSTYCGSTGFRKVRSGRQVQTRSIDFSMVTHSTVLQCLRAILVEAAVYEERERLAEAAAANDRAHRGVALRPPPKSKRRAAKEEGGGRRGRGGGGGCR